MLVLDSSRRKIPFCHSQVPSNPCAALVRCVKGPTGMFLTVCGSFPPTSRPSVLCNLPMNHIRGLQTAQQAPTGELMMFSPLWSHSSLGKLLTIYLDVIIVCDIIKEKNLHLCRPAHFFCCWSCYDTEGQCSLNNLELNSNFALELHFI